jgi:hypothetical protein
MRADRANTSGNGNALLVGGAEEGKGSAACRQAEGSRRIACGSRVIQLRRSARPATSTRAGSVRAGPTCVQQAQAQVAARDDGPHSRDGPDPLWLLMPGTGPAANTVDNRSGRPGRRHALVKAFSRAHFTQPQAGPGWAAQFSILLQDEVLGPEASRGSHGMRNEI